MTKQIRCNNTKCRRVWNYQGEKRKGAKTRCPDCTRTVTIPLLLMLAIIPLASVAMAEQQVAVTLPIDRPFSFDSCGLLIGSQGPTYSCVWSWTIDPEALALVEQRPLDNSTAYELWLTEILPLIEANPFIEPEVAEEIVDETSSDPKPNPDFDELTQTEIDAINALDECLRGFDRNPALGAFQADSEIEGYANVTRGEIAYRDNLSKNQPILKMLKAVEECRGIQRYLDMNIIGAEEANKAIADRLGLDVYGRSEITARGNEPSLDPMGDKSASNEEIVAQATKWGEWACKDENRHLKLCQDFEFAGVEMGHDRLKGYTEGIECQTQGQPSSELGSAPKERCPMQEFNEYKQSDPTAGDVHTAIQKSVCDMYAGKYDYLAIDKRPEWLSHCYQ